VRRPIHILVVLIGLSTLPLGALTSACDRDEAAPDTEQAEEEEREGRASVTPGEPGLGTEPSGRRVLRAPGLDGWDFAALPEAYRHEGPGLVAVPFHVAGEVYVNASASYDVLGVVRRGTPVEVGRRVFGAGCDGGAWYEVKPFGVVCTTRGFNVSAVYDDRGLWVHSPDISGSRPFRYVKAEDGAPRFFRVPTAEEDAAARAAEEGAGPFPEVVEAPMTGVYLLAIAEEAEGEAGMYYRTVANRYVRASDVEDKPLVTMRGELLGDEVALPLAFVYVEDRPLFAVDGDGVREVGVAELHARFPFVEERTIGGTRYVIGPDDMAVPAEGVRVVRPIERPADRIPPDQKWIHVDLAEQTLVAYEGDRPVFATLVSSGKEGYETPKGTFQMDQKFITITMSGDDPVEGFYEVEEVPWTMYYWNSFALHGAYWHDGFGQVRSHGCTNIPPPDARWLYHWSDPQVPGGFHGIRRRRGTWVHLTR
jgi:hypothetical protein